PGGPYTTTPLAYRDLLYAVRDEGVLGVYEVKTGALVYRERTGTTHSASPVASDGKVYLAGEDGQLLVLRAGRAFELLTRIDMGETVFATPAISRGTLYVRTRGHLYAIAGPA
ncbi:MAG: PQQ-binding-like beta-propeller repeat protein, partial [Burkholderiales bacterium]